MPPQDVVDVDALHREHVDVRDIARGQGEIGFELGAVDDERARESELGEVLLQCGGLAILHGRLLEHDDAAVLGLGGQGVLESERAHLLRQIDRMATGGWSERAAAAAEEIDPAGAVTCRAGALLPVHFLAGTVDFATVLDVVRAALTLGELPAHTTMQDVCSRLEAKDRVGHFDRTRRLAVERHDLEFHVTHFRSRRPWPLQRALLRFDLWRLPPPLDETCRVWERPSAAFSSLRRVA